MKKSHKRCKKLGALILTFIMVFAVVSATPVFAALAEPVIGSSDKGDGTYNNPFIWADAPDPSMIRVGDTYWMSSTTMHMNPGVPIMKSKDMVNWETVSYCYLVHGDTAAMRLNGGNMYANGTWASSLSHRLVDDGKGGKKDEFICVVPSPSTNNTHIFKTEDPENIPWTRYDMGARYHDCALLIDDDGRNWLTWGTNIREMNSQITGWAPGSSQRNIIDSLHAPHPTTGVRPTSGLAEGLHMKKANGYYYIIAITWPSGWPRTIVCHRAKSLDTPPTGWEHKVVGMENVNYGGGGGVAQGSIVEAQDGRWFGYAFRDSGAVGRIPWVVPITWVDDWPMFGQEGSYTPYVPNYTTAGPIPFAGASAKKSVVSSDEFYNNAKKPTYHDSNLPFTIATPAMYAYNGSNLNIDWQWNHNMDNRYWSLTERPGWLRLTTSRTVANIIMAPNTLTQRAFGPQNAAVTCIDVSNMKEGDEAGISLFTAKYGSIGVKMENGNKYIVTMISPDSNANSYTHTSNRATESGRIALVGNKVYLKAEANFTTQSDRGNFFYSYDGINWTKLGGELIMVFHYANNHFMGYRVGLYNFAKTTAGGYVDFDFFRINDRLTAATAPTILGAGMNDAGVRPGTTNIEVPVMLEPLPNGSHTGIHASFNISDGMTVTGVDFGTGVTGTGGYEVRGNQLLLSVTGSSVDFKTSDGLGEFATIKLKLASGYELLTNTIVPDYVIVRSSQDIVYDLNGVSFTLSPETDEGYFKLEAVIAKTTLDLDETVNVTINAIHKEGAKINVMSSPNLKVAVGDGSVVSYEAGVLKALALGKTTLNIVYTDPSGTTLPLTVNLTVGTEVEPIATSISVNGKSVTGFSPFGLIYTLVAPVAQTMGISAVLPTIAGLSYTVDYPAAMPGTATVTVTSAWGKSRTYTLSLSYAAARVSDPKTSTMTFTADLGNPTDEVKYARVIAAAYDAGGRLVEIKPSARITIPANGYVDAVSEALIIDANVHTVKGFIWDDDRYIPYSFDWNLYEAVEVWKRVPNAASVVAGKDYVIVSAITATLNRAMVNTGVTITSRVGLGYSAMATTTYSGSEYLNSAVPANALWTTATGSTTGTLTFKNSAPGGLVTTDYLGRTGVGSGGTATNVDLGNSNTANNINWRLTATTGGNIAMENSDNATLYNYYIHVTNTGGFRGYYNGTAATSATNLNNNASMKFFEKVTENRPVSS